MRKTQYSVRRLRLRTLLEAAHAVTGRLGPFADLDGSWTVLAEAERIAPDVVEDVLMHPSVGVWLSRALRQVLGTAADATPLWSEVGWFHAVAAAAAVRSGLSCAIAVPVVHGAVSLPSVGAYRLPNRFPVGHARLLNSDNGLSVEVAGETRTVGWEAVKRHRGTARGHTVDVVVDDLDPYREFTGPVPPGPLDDSEWDQWRKLLNEAWDLLTARHPGPAEELAAGLTTVIPLDARRDMFAASSAAAYGAIAMSPKRSATEFGEALVHELQHSKVNALLDLVELHRADREPAFYAPWRDDPRPLDGLLHGVYAFVSVVEFWHAQHDLVTPPLARRAEFNLAFRARQVGVAVAGMCGLTQLTDLGREFVAAVAVRLAACEPVDVSPATETAVAELTAEHATTWRLRHIRPDQRSVAEVVAAWLDGRTPPDLVPDGEVVPTAASGESLLAGLLKLRVLDPVEFDRVPDRAGPEFAYVRGERAAAADGYAARLRAASHDVASWAGLGLALDSTALRRVPELVRAVHHDIAVRTGTAPAPLRLVAWFDRAMARPVFTGDA
ncbi:HEXXH motif-containing protein [Saccharothrix ecbatanensis]|uniref:HEXXH motif-containing protein n=1 Tax=Saccharothrix ecbatanensis TaxID=1105145 RepID=A0A7W9M1X3_9PSEU|nr:HEXXH motif-containing putative peptide modification protein [Saccharothrix ecbatanensis]MBB5804313.1 HEXXH motif-containing protein [Saccharothrix ecbatanensis]